METFKNSSVDFDQCVQNGKSTNIQETEDIHSISFSYSNMKKKMLCFYRRQTFTDEGEKSVTGNITANIATNLGKKVKIINFFYHFSILLSFFNLVIPI